MVYKGRTSYMSTEKLFSLPVTRREFVGTAVVAGAWLRSSLVSAGPPAKPAHPICIFSKHLQWLSIPDMARTAAGLGFDGVDLTVRKGGHVDPTRVSTELPAAVAVIRKAGLDVPMIATDVIDPADPLSELVIKTAATLGIGIYRTAYLQYDRSRSITNNLTRFRAQLEKLAVLNRKYGIHGAYQNHSGTNVGAAVWDLWELLRDVDPQWLGCQYDIKHATAEGGMSWVNGLGVMQSHIRCFDLKDFYWQKQGGQWRHKLVPLGEGMVDFKTYFGLLKQHRLAGPMSIHYEYPLGGAETGNQQLNIPPDAVLMAIERDLRTVRTLLTNAGLGN